MLAQVDHQVLPQVDHQVQVLAQVDHLVQILAQVLVPDHQALAARRDGGVELAALVPPAAARRDGGAGALRRRLRLGLGSARTPCRTSRRSCGLFG